MTQDILDIPRGLTCAEYGLWLSLKRIAGGDQESSVSLVDLASRFVAMDRKTMERLFQSLVSKGHIKHLSGDSYTAMFSLP